MAKELRTIDPSQPFECGGKKYAMSEKLSFNRYKKLQEFSIELGFSASFALLFSNLRKFWDLYNAGKAADGIVVIHNVMNGITILEKKHDVSLRMCAMFINEAGEDVSEFDEAKMNAKIDTWAKELDIKPFFQLASNLVPGWMPAYEIALRDFSNRGTTNQNTSIK